MNVIRNTNWGLHKTLEHFLEKSERCSSFIPAFDFCHQIGGCFYEKRLQTHQANERSADQLRKLRRQFLRYQQAEIVYSLSHKKLFELASDAGAIYRFDSTVLINRDIFDAYLERFHEPAREITAEEVEDE